jgi:geranylgeranyl diphosphate synthase type II
MSDNDLDGVAPPWFEKTRAIINCELDRILPGQNDYPETIHRAMRYAVFSGGKRLRPILCLEAGRFFGRDDEGLLRVCIAFELVHAASLIHDDLPALDACEVRRGKPSCHEVFGEAVAILAGDALLVLAFEALAGNTVISEVLRLRLVQELAHAIGTRGGMVAGEIADIETPTPTVSRASIQFINLAKTAALIRTALRAGARYAGAEERDISVLDAYGQNVGLAFQIADDLLDVAGAPETLHNTTCSDAFRRKATYPDVYGIGEARDIATQFVISACRLLKPYGERASRLIQLAEYAIAGVCHI